VGLEELGIGGPETCADVLDNSVGGWGCDGCHSNGRTELELDSVFRAGVYLQGQLDKDDWPETEAGLAGALGVLSNPEPLAAKYS